MHLRLVLVAMGIGVVAELVARALRLWLFRHWSLAIVNIVIVYGLIMGTLATEVRTLGNFRTFVVAAVIGTAFELANLWFLHFWRFPDEHADTPSGRFARIAVLAVLWGLMPIATLRAHAAFQSALFPHQKTSTPLEELNQREQSLLRKLDELHNRVRGVENRLEVLRQRKEDLVHKLEPRQPGATRTAHEENK